MKDLSKRSAPQMAHDLRQANWKSVSCLRARVMRQSQHLQRAHASVEMAGERNVLHISSSRAFLISWYWRIIDHINACSYFWTIDLTFFGDLFAPVTVNRAQFLRSNSTSTCSDCMAYRVIWDTVSLLQSILHVFATWYWTAPLHLLLAVHGT